MVVDSPAAVAAVEAAEAGKPALWYHRSMKKWLIPVAALFLVAIIAFVTKSFVLKGPDKEHYKIYMVAEGDKGRQGKKFGCDDSLVAIERQVVSGSTISDVYQDFLDIHDQKYEDTGLTNALYQSDLHLDSGSILGGTAHIFLSGTLKKPADDCERQRIQAMLEEPAKQFDGVRSIDVKVNNIPLDEALKQ